MSDRGTEGPGGSVGALPEAFAAEAGPIARYWPTELLRDDPDAPPVSEDHAAALTTAVAHALADDLAPLTSQLGLDDGSGDPQVLLERLDTGLRRLDAVRRVAQRRPALRLRSTVDEIDAAFATVARQAATQGAAVLAARALAAEERASSGSASMAVTMHELRRPLTVLSSYSQLFSSGVLGELSDRGQSAAATMVSASEVMLRLIEALSALARLEDPAEPETLRPVDVDEVIAAALSDVETEAHLKSVAFQVDVEPGLLVRGDRERLSLAVTNLVSNAVKHSPEGSGVEVRAYSGEGAAHVVVRDRGPGFPDDAAERLFEKYYRDAGERERGIPGTGLGLYIVTTVAARHNGRAQARNAPGGGAEFELTVPLIRPGR